MLHSSKKHMYRELWQPEFASHRELHIRETHSLIMEHLGEVAVCQSVSPVGVDEQFWQDTEDIPTEFTDKPPPDVCVPSPRLLQQCTTETEESEEGELLPLEEDERVHVGVPVDPADKKNNRRYMHEEIYGGAQYEIPNGARVINLIYLKKLQQEAASFRKLHKALSKPAQKLTEETKFLTGAAIACAPAISTYAFPRMGGMLRAALVSQAGVQHMFSLEEVVASAPSPNTVHDCIRSCGASCLLALQKELRMAAAVFLGCDKGNKKGVDHLSKVVSWWCTQEMLVKWVCVDYDCLGSSTNDVACAIQVSLKQKLNNVVTGFDGQSTDSAGGGVLVDLAKSLESLGLMNDKSVYMVVGCLLHALQRPFENGIKAAFGGEGSVGISKRNLSQLLYDCWSMQQCCKEEFYDMWKLANGSPIEEKIVIKKIGRPTTNRWWNFPVATVHVLQNSQGWCNLAKHLGTWVKKLKLALLCGSDVYAMLQENEILLDGEFIRVFATTLFFPAWHWLQEPDELARCWAHRSWPMLEHWFLFRQKLKKHQAEWRTMEEYANFRTKVADAAEQMVATKEPEICSMRSTTYTNRSFNNFTTTIQYKKVDYFFKAFVDNAEKHFSRWVTAPLVLCAIGGSKKPVQALAGWLVKGTVPSSTDSWDPSSVHPEEFLDGKVIPMSFYINYVSTLCKQESVLALEWLKTHKNALTKLADVENCQGLWDDTVTNHDSDMKQLRDWILTHVLPLMSSTHYIEACICESSIVATQGRGQGIQSVLVVLARSTINKRASRKVNESEASSVLKTSPTGALRASHTYSLLWM